MKKDFQKTIQNLSMNDVQNVQQTAETQEIPGTKTDHRFRKNPNLVTCSFRTENDLKEQVYAIACQQNTTLSAIINDLLKEFVSKHKN